MHETNIRIVNPGTSLYVLARRAAVSGSHLAPDLLQRVCGRLRYQYGLAAIPYPGEPETLLVATAKPIHPMRIEGDEWELSVRDSGMDTARLTLADSHEADLLRQLVQRALLAKLAKTDLWTLDSPRIWYEPEPFRIEEGVAAYRRYPVDTWLIDGVGIGQSVHIETAFFTVSSLAYFFDPNVSPEEQGVRADLFERLTDRQPGHKGTLRYDIGRKRMKCYFESAPAGITCATAGPIKVGGRRYDTLADYYRVNYPNLPIDENGIAVQVSFKYLQRPVWVAAELLHIRVMNSALPDKLDSVDKLDPDERRSLLQRFWEGLGSRPLGKVAPGYQKDFWRPPQDRIVELLPPDLTFGRGHRLEAPLKSSVGSYRSNYWQRMESLEEVGCYSVPPDVTRSIYLAYPEHLEEEGVTQLASDLGETSRQLTGLPIETIPVAYRSVSEAVEQLRAADRSGLVVFILNEEPDAYHEVAFQLDRWRVKRITKGVFEQHCRYFKKGRWDRRSRSYNVTLGKKRWEDFVRLNVLDILQLLDVVPFRFDQAGQYEAQLVIDVGYDRRHFALALLIARGQEHSPSFRLTSRVYTKPDHYSDAINSQILMDHVVELFETALGRTFDPIGSLLVLRDGQFRGEEFEAMINGEEKLTRQGLLSPKPVVHLADIRKDTPIRVWKVGATGEGVNPLEKTLLKLNAKTVIVASTGAATLHQGTSKPFVIEGNGRCPDIVGAATAAVTASELNWSSPKVAQRLPIYLKRADEDLKARDAQEVRRVR